MKLAHQINGLLDRSMAAETLWILLFVSLGADFMGPASIPIVPAAYDRHLTKCGIPGYLPHGAYVLDNDVSSVGTCFSIQASLISS